MNKLLEIIANIILTPLAIVIGVIGGVVVGIGFVLYIPFACVKSLWGKESDDIQ